MYALLMKKIINLLVERENFMKENKEKVISWLEEKTSLIEPLREYLKL